MGTVIDIDWTAYDFNEKFRVFEAACLWVGIEPTREVWRVPPPNVTAMVRAIEKHTGGHHSSGIATASQGFLDPEVEVSRAALIKMANQSNQKPAFLFPEVRTGSGKPQGAETLGGRAETTYLNIIAALLDCIAGNLPNVKKHPSFESEAKLIEVIDENFRGYGGLSKSNLSRKFPEAKRTLQAQ
ncbi:MAG: hypothetical protein Q8O38_01650 [Sulfurimicrobium sp.]|nr:hypothetical protein [Sulfurimicrobium sp.]